ncbi:hypothetical protein Nepgr_007834 [Nepenthes gracilis]|uniref:Uncharacterized protein n=1 Tax=Nepenthes gracilis TaxID=150966 RepID=A0AAD3S7Z9_NEPGR|nr:hypothetical protein Nepgr_007834 [Nepenthes gracilis]
MAESTEIEGFAEDETTEYPGETVQLGREQSWICPNSKTSFGFEEKNTKIESPLRSQGEQRMRIRPSFWRSMLMAWCSRVLCAVLQQCGTDARRWIGRTPGPYLGCWMLT